MISITEFLMDPVNFVINANINVKIENETLNSEDLTSENLKSSLTFDKN